MRDMRRLYPYIRPHLSLLLLSLLLLFGSALLEGAIVALLQPIFDGWSPGRVAGAFDAFADGLGLLGGPAWKIPALLVLMALIKGLFLYVSEYAMGRVGQNVIAALRNRMHAHLVGQSMNFFANNSTGQLMARVITDTERIQQTVSKTLADAGRQAILLLTFLGILLYIDWKLTLATFLLGPPATWITVRLGRRLRSVALRSQQDLSDLSQSLQETLSGQRIVKAFAMEDYEQGRFETMVSRLVRNNLRVVRISALSSPLMEVVGYLAFAPLLLYANHQIQQGLSLGSMAAFIVSLFRLYDPLRKLSRMHLVFQQAFASSSRVFELLDTPVDLQESPEAVELEGFAEQIRFEGVSLRYAGNGLRPALEGINLIIPKREVIALVGSSGAGKTSLAGLIPRFYDPTQGRVTIDGLDIRNATLKSLRNLIAIVTQDTFLFNDSVRSNIAYGDQRRPMAEVEQAARASYIHDFILEELPQGYETVLGERGQKLSGGQQQRIAIARAVLKKAPILILDEATSALDSESERLVQKALQDLMRHCTTLVIAHRLSTIRQADRIIVMEQGRIVETGKHGSLLRRDGPYRRYYRLQLEH